MQGLLLKDFYLIKKYCRVFVLAIIIFLGVAFLQKDNTFFLFYPAIMAGLLPMTLYSYDEREKWNAYSAALPYTRVQLVSAKYLVGLFSTLSIVGIVAVLQAVFQMNTGAFVLQEYIFTLAVMLMLGLFGPSLLMPFVFKLGAEKGRIAYYIVLILCFMLCAIVGDFDTRSLWLGNNLGLGIIFVGIIGLYGISWLLSIVFYQRREL